MKMVSLFAEAEQKGKIDLVNRAVSGRQKEQKADAAEELNGNGNQIRTKDATVQISEEAMQKYAEMQSMLHDMEVAKQQGDAMQEAADNMGKIMVIFRRICHGDIVPLKDERMLMDYSGELYQAAKMAAAMAKNKKPEKYKSVDEEEDAAVSGIGEAVLADSAGTAEGGAEICEVGSVEEQA